VPEVVGEPEEFPDDVSLVDDDPELIDDEPAPDEEDPMPDEPERMPLELQAPRTSTQVIGRIQFFMRSSLKIIE
jgi:hypothetical protein